MNAIDACAIAIWTAFDYAAPKPPADAARAFLAEIEALGWTITQLDDRK